MFQALKGVISVEQGFVASTGNNKFFSEAVIIHFNSKSIALKTLIEIHLHTHKSTSLHSMRKKYRSAIYTFSQHQIEDCKIILEALQAEFNNKIITRILPFSEFKASRVAIQNYYKKNPEKPFCKRFINPKLEFLTVNFSKVTDLDKLNKT